MPLDFFVWSEQERKVYRGQKMGGHHRGAQGKADSCSKWNPLLHRQLSRLVGAVPKRLQVFVTAHGARFENMLG